MAEIWLFTLILPLNNMHFILKPNIKQLFKQEASVFSFEHNKNSIQKDLNSFEQWLEKNAHAEMHFLKNNHEARSNPELILEEVKTALIFLFPYAYGNKIRSRLGNINTINKVEENSVIGKKLISKYVYGKDYHKIIKKTLNTHAEKLKEFLQLDFQYRPVVDSIPFFDRAHAREADMGFIGKNTMLIRPGMGSFFFIATLLTNISIDKLAHKLDKRKVFDTLDCGTCTKCMDACPTGALEQDYFLNANKCLSYLSIEHRDIVDTQYIPHFKETLYGCDICQNVCPYNSITLDSYLIPEFARYHEPFTILTAEQIALMTKEQYAQWFGGTAATRAKYEGLVRNALYHIYATGDPNISAVCMKSLNHPSVLVKKTVAQLLELLGKQKL